MAAAQRDGSQAVFEDPGGYGALARQAAQGEGPLVGRLQWTSIQLAATPVFTRKGAAETMVNDLLEATWVLRRTFCKHLAGKLEVLESICHSAVQLPLACFGGPRSEAGSGEGWLRTVVSLFFDYHLVVGPIIRTMQEEALHTGSSLAAHRQRTHLKTIELWAERLNAQDVTHDALAYRVLIQAMETASLELLNVSDPLELPQVKWVLDDLLVGTLCPSTQAPTKLQKQQPGNHRSRLQNLGQVRSPPWLYSDALS